MSLADYLVKNYLTADLKSEKKSKKRKRKDGNSGLTIADDDALGWNPNGSSNVDEDAPITISGRSSEFRKAKSSAWQAIGAPTPSSSDQAAADAIIASAASENNARALADEDAPAIHDSSSAQMESGAQAGLQTAEQVTAQVKRRQEAEKAQSMQDSSAHSGANSETIYRDASGRIINVAMKRAEARKKAEAEVAKAAAELEAQKGDVQRAAAAKRKEDLKEAKYMPVARYADDANMNEELKGRERWNDPAAGFLEKKQAGKSVSGKPLYKGSAMPNRYGIRPGHRWDGVDRGIGFEKEWFAARNKKANLKELDYAWQMDE